MNTTEMNQKKPKNDKGFRIFNYCLMIVLALTCLGLSIYYKAIGDPNNRFLASLGVALLFILPALIELIFRCKISSLIVLCYVIYSVLAGLLGCVFNFYNLPNLKLDVWYDIFIHGLAGYVFCFIGLIIISRFEKYKNLSPWTVLFFCVFFTLATELIWELMEWFADKCLGQNSQGFAPDGQSAPLVTDTNIDMLCNFTGAVLFILHFVIGKFTKLTLGMNYIEEEFCGNKIIVKNKKRNTVSKQNEVMNQAPVDNENQEHKEEVSDENQKE